MGKVTGFLEIDRNDRHYAPVAERIKHWHEFVLPLAETDIRNQAARCMDCGVPYCHGTSRITGAPTGCPVNNQIPDWNDLVYRGRWDEAARNLHSTNNFPEFTGRVCPAPCEASCTLNIDDNPVTIKSIECEIADRAIAQGLKPELPAHKTGKKVAIVGSGPAGLACAQQLARAGHEVHVFERWAKAGGLLRYGIPDFKMEKVHVDRRIEQMQGEGVQFHYGADIGVNVPVDQLMAPEALPDIPQVKPAGGKEPPVTIVEYASMTCTHCAAFHATTYPVLISKYVDTGKVRFILREFPLDELATAAFMLARCAGTDKRNAMVDLLFQQQHNWAFTDKPVEALEGLVRQTGMSHEAFEACLRDKALRDKVDEVRDRAANKFGVNATPTFFFNGIRHNGELTPDDLDKLLEPMLKG